MLGMSGTRCLKKNSIANKELPSKLKYKKQNYIFFMVFWGIFISITSIHLDMYKSQ
jgi:hypothetical protein